MTKKKIRLWSKSGSGDYLFCTCDCTDYKTHSDVQQSKSEFMAMMKREHRFLWRLMREPRRDRQAQP